MFNATILHIGSHYAIAIAECQQKKKISQKIFLGVLGMS